jgi:microsomal dipeptidase-like Zn-dependent dipeptidase
MLLMLRGGRGPREHRHRRLVEPRLLPDYDNFTALVDAMLRGGCTATDTAKIVGGNYVRVFAASVR